MIVMVSGTIFLGHQQPPGATSPMPASTYRPIVLSSLTTSEPTTLDDTSTKEYRHNIYNWPVRFEPLFAALIAAVFAAATSSPSRQLPEPHSRRGAKTTLEIPIPIPRNSHALRVNRISMCLDTQGLLQFLKPRFMRLRQGLGFGIAIFSERTLGSSQSVLRLP
jgi:hypothetical protein